MSISFVLCCVLCVFLSFLIRLFVDYCCFLFMFFFSLFCVVILLYFTLIILAPSIICYLLLSSFLPISAHFCNHVHDLSLCLQLHTLFTSSSPPPFASNFRVSLVSTEELRNNCTFPPPCSVWCCRSRCSSCQSTAAGSSSSSSASSTVWPRC